jgi:hypothetical protein
MDRIRNDIANPEGVFIFNGAHIAKSGAKSVGVSRQRNGRRGKLQLTSQVILRHGGEGLGYPMLNVRLRISKRWHADECEKLRKSLLRSRESRI